MRTVGVDLAADPARTGLCEIDWAHLELTVHERPVTDEVIVATIAAADVAGLDVPLGWPDDFVAAVRSHSEQQGWPPAALDAPADREALRFRLTDLDQMSRGSRPLSVSTDRIGVAAMRGARLQQMLVSAGVHVDRSGTTGAVVETYPAAALRAWGLRSRVYKRATNRDVLHGLLHDFAMTTGPLGERVEALGSAWTDDDFDAVVCAVVALAARRGLTAGPGTGESDRARREGWIHVPTAPLAEIVAVGTDS